MKWLKVILEISIGIILILAVICVLHFRTDILDFAQEKVQVILDKYNTLPAVTQEVKEEETKSREEMQSQEEVQSQEEIQNQEESTIDKEYEEESVVESSESLLEESSQDGLESKEEKKITVTFAGDILLTGYLLSQYDGKGIPALVSEDILNDMKSSDLMIANEEFPFSSGGKPAANKQFTFRIEPNRANVLTELGIDLVTLANNHSLDYGREALADTFQTLEQQGIRYAGAGVNLERASQLQTFQVADKTIGILAASRVLPENSWNASASKAGIFSTYDATTLLEEIRQAKKSCNFVVVYIHWGVEKKETPEEYQRELAKQYIDAGADLVVGSHPHVLQGIEYYNGKPIVYSLGNFIFGSQIQSTGLLQIKIAEDNSFSLRVIPCKTDENYTLQTITDARELFDYLTKISYHAKIDSEGNILTSE